ncbi:hypothetical protein J5751_02765 [bacterium]|nr:hypothetical protein [bacterium]
MSFAKFTEITGTREMSTTCCGYIDHTTNIKNTEQIHDLLLKLSAQIYSESRNKQKTLNTLSNIFGTCSKKQKNTKVRAVCDEFYYDLIGINPVISKITFDDVIKSLKTNKFIKRGIQYSDLVENYTPINYHYASIRSMYMA